MKNLNFQGKNVRYHVQGEGEPLVLLHGYLESLEVWNGFADELAKSFRILRMDLPGHGESQTMAEIHSMEMMADVVNALLEEEEITKTTIIGHSLGGYVTLAFLEKYPEKVRRLSLFHAHPFSDSEQVKENRRREIELVRTDQKSKIIHTFVPRLFADKNLESMKEKMEWVRKIAFQTPGDGIIANLRGMMERPDRKVLLKNTDKPFLMIAGKHDKFINYEAVVPKIGLPRQGKLFTLEDSGHLGFVEEKPKSLEIVYDFMIES
jgi:pimeloyl-ACP methyl ester carboxylesterase